MISSASTFARALVLIAFAFAVFGVACKSATPPTAFGVNLTVDARPLTNRMGITTLRVAVSGGETFSKDFDVTSLIAGTGLFHTHYVPGISTGTLIFDVKVLTADGTVRGLATPSNVTLVPGGVTDITIVLTDGALTDAGVDALPAECSNGVIDTGESDIDCAGSCPKCEPGRACMTGSDCATGTCVAMRCELATDLPKWVDLPQLTLERATPIGGARDDGTIWVIGGLSNIGFEASTSFYQMSTNSWSAGPPLTEPRIYAAGVVTNNEFFVIGGQTTIGVGMYDTLATIAHAGGTTLAWNTLMRTLSSKRQLLGAALGSDGLIYVAGGTSATSGMMPPVDELVSFNPVADSTEPPTVLTKMPTARAQLGLAGDGSGHIVAAGGIGPDNIATTGVDIYTINPPGWTTGPPLAQARRNPAGVLGPDGRIYMVGGNDDADASIRSVEALSADGKYWTPISSLGTPRTRVGITRGWDGRIYALGGQQDGSDGMLAPTKIAQAYGPRLTLGPSTGAPGSIIAIGGSNFARDAKVTISFSDRTLVAPITVSTSAGDGSTDASADEGGDIKPSYAWTVPQIPPGTYFFTAVDEKSRFPVRAHFTVPAQ